MPRRSARRIKEIEERLGDAAAGLAAVHQGRPDRRLHRVLRRPRPRKARAGLGHDIRADARAKPSLVSGFAAEFDALIERLNDAAVRSAAGRAQTRRGAARSPASRRSSPAWRRRSASSCRRRSAVRRLDPAADAARRLFHFRHAGGHADRPPDRGAGAHLRHGPAARAEPAAGAGAQLFPGSPVRKDVIFGEAMLVSERAVRPRGAECSCVADRRRGAAWSCWSAATLLLQTRTAEPRPGSTRWRRRSPATSDRVRPAARAGGRRRPAAVLTAAGPGPRSAARRTIKARGWSWPSMPVAGGQAGLRLAHRLSAALSNGRCCRA